jgi:hypothetical protein
MADHGNLPGPSEKETTKHTRSPVIHAENSKAPHDYPVLLNNYGILLGFEFL